jgi:MarR family transcriptional regulator for hemolysin
MRGRELGGQRTANVSGGSGNQDHGIRIEIKGFLVKSFDIESLESDELCYRRPMPRPAGLPIGIRLASTAKSVSRAFDEALSAAGGSLPVWLILISLKSERVANQRQLADAVGIQEATLSHHLNTMEAGGLVTRRRDPTNRRIHQVQLTDEGETLFRRLATAARAHDARLRAGLSDSEIATLEGLLDRLRHNVSGD